jgi:hypothetical protein
MTEQITPTINQPKERGERREGPKVESESAVDFLEKARNDLLEGAKLLKEQAAKQEARAAQIEAAITKLYEDQGLKREVPSDVSQPSREKKPSEVMREKIITTLYNAKARSVENVLSQEELVDQIGQPWNLIEPEISYLIQKGLITREEMQEGIQIFRSYYLTAEGVDKAEQI